MRQAVCDDKAEAAVEGTWGKAPARVAMRETQLSRLCMCARVGLMLLLRGACAVVPGALLGNSTVCGLLSAAAARLRQTPEHALGTRPVAVTFYFAAAALHACQSVLDDLSLRSRRRGVTAEAIYHPSASLSLLPRALL